MALALRLEKSLWFPHSVNSGGGSPRKVHWVGGKAPVEQGQIGGENKNPKKDIRGYHSLSEIKIGDVRDAINFFSNQLSPCSIPGWVAPGYFCTIPLARTPEPRPSVVFGRVKTCYPGDGYLHNIQEMEILFPKLGAKPLEINLRPEDIDYNAGHPLQSYYVKVKFFASEDDLSDFAGQESLFNQQGLEIEFVPRSIDLLDVTEFNHQAFPNLIVIGSRWFDSIPSSFKHEVREKLPRLIQWNKLLVNYHPVAIHNKLPTLNRELGYKFGFSETVLVEPETPEQTLQIVSQSFDRIFMQGMG